MISENVGLFLLQSLGGVRAGGTEGLPEDGGERKSYRGDACKHNRPYHVYPWQTLKHEFGHDTAERETYYICTDYNPHVFADISDSLTLHGSSEYLMYGNAFGILFCKV